MRSRILAAMLMPVVLLLVPVSTIGQSQPSQPRTAKWDPPRTPWGDPDIQGVWNNVTGTPLERPAQLKDKALLTKEEAAAFEKQITELIKGGEAKPIREQSVGERTGYAASIWFETGYSLSGNRTSLLVDPPDGRLPALTPEAKIIADRQAEASKVSPADKPEDRGSYERCITRALPGSMMPGFYNHNYQILQTPGYVVIAVEMIHDARIIPMDGRPHVGSGIKQWLGDSRGRWEGNTLVVETTNFTDKDAIGSNGAGYPGDPGYHSEHLKVIERFTRVSDTNIEYRITVIDDKTWTKPWTILIQLEKDDKYQFLEYACHEGNYAMADILSGARATEKQ